MTTPEASVKQQQELWQSVAPMMNQIAAMGASGCVSKMSRLYQTPFYYRDTVAKSLAEHVIPDVLHRTAVFLRAAKAPGAIEAGLLSLESELYPTVDAPKRDSVVEQEFNSIETAFKIAQMDAARFAKRECGIDTDANQLPRIRR